MKIDWDAWSGSAVYSVERDPDGDFGPGAMSAISYWSPPTQTYTVARQGLADLLHQTFRVRPCLDLALTSCITTPDVTLSGNLTNSIGRISGVGATRFEAMSAIAYGKPAPTIEVLVLGLPNANADVGRVRLFTRVGAGASGTGAWVLAQTLTKPSGGTMGDKFGQSVALSQDGRWLAVGVPGDGSVPDTPPLDAHKAGATYVYAVSTSTGQATLSGAVHAANPGRDDAFGSAVALDATGTVLMVGAPFEDSAAAGAYLPADATERYPDAGGTYDHRDYGAVYVFKRSATTPTSWVFDRYVKPWNSDAGSTPDLRKEGYFGSSLAISGDYVAIGSPGSSRGAAHGGSVQVLAWNSWTFSQERFSTDAQTTGPSQRRFGAAVAYAAGGTLLAIGDPDATVDGKSGAGLVHLVSRSASTWSHLGTRQAPRPALNARFGSAVALTGAGSDRLLVGAPGDSSGLAGLQRFAEVQADAGTSRGASGAVYHYQNLSGDWRLKARLKAPTPTSNAEFGKSIAVDASGAFTAVGSVVRDDLGGEVFIY